MDELRELTNDDLIRASDLGADAAADDNNGVLPSREIPLGDEMWNAVMGDEDRSEYPDDSVKLLREAYDDGYATYL